MRFKPSHASYCFGADMFKVYNIIIQSRESDSSTGTLSSLNQCTLRTIEMRCDYNKYQINFHIITPLINEIII
jgi:hypothetical protein